MLEKFYLTHLTADARVHQTVAHQVGSENYVIHYWS